MIPTAMIPMGMVQGMGMVTIPPLATVLMEIPEVVFLLEALALVRRLRDASARATRSRSRPFPALRPSSKHGWMQSSML